MSSALKRCRPFLQRAEELATIEPVVAHYCRVWAVDLLGKARQGGDSSPELANLLLQELGKAEATKNALDLANGRDTMEAFALGVFERVNAADCAGAADAAAASQYYVAGLFLEACAQFYEGELPPDLAEKARFAKYRAVHIRDCLRRGVAPEAPGAAPEAAPEAAAAAAPLAPAAAAAGAVGSYPAAPGPSVGAAAAARSAAAEPPLPAPASVAGPLRSLDPWNDAKRQAELAAWALEWNDVAPAKKYLMDCLRLLDDCVDS